MAYTGSPCYVQEGTFKDLRRGRQHLHGFVVAADGAWVVVQQGTDPARRQALRTPSQRDPHA